MSLTSFFQFIEIKTKLASMIPFILGTLYSLYRYKSFNSKNFIIMSISLLAFDMATTAINNYIDYKKALKSQENKNEIPGYGFSESTALTIIFILLLIAISFGILLTLNTNVIVLLIGVISFLAGILYTYGPIPISRTPFGEIFSGVFMGFIILFLSLYIHIFDKNIVSFMYANNMLTLSLNLVEVFYIFLISIPTMCGIANIMLANNICDVKEDILNNRYTLPHYLGVKNALKLFKILYYIGYLDIIILVILKISPAISLLVILTIIPLNKNIKIFYKDPIKSKTFVYSVKNFALINMVHILSVSIALILNFH
ncbi:1,4-dihydroxy-2-naphthoate polyprenyltransferase [Clostridium tagluense]|uniref:1,4-dihydroxy-2-naphthoate polyprenyltransferase n=1 Tax=Clostridium tagluense TaxID=360422 RepID=UPI001C0C4922|nr:1,4-dihydroxy-2-naphthoate polyprenyltransferase [Clostridium tagluense]MBU3126153.1 1,4-dihydroxy-2-naphthoate polyprenyltransferase [Clostridium tagluense]MCB2309534.1 1,4-dihydroxy-2-naphthoate polyprenyltransferase [Clostridium tagluense]MCB2314936.1 1,4-dihydroxy-2-naphthoate polyprenyltransferase [Clostridium tagluense]MCB2319785.1 1,4-dihydroxy-2-naphthoate polyprenyltransferase [Clostridium tagluense]MCB2324128.1 1,4-dihydroxy-2-naphthoate polyprenyltransferase [Clostridium tagluens